MASCGFIARISVSGCRQLLGLQRQGHAFEEGGRQEEGFANFCRLPASRCLRPRLPIDLAVLCIDGRRSRSWLWTLGHCRLLSVAIGDIILLVSTLFVSLHEPPQGLDAPRDMPLTRSAARALAASKKGKEEAEQAPAAVQPGQRLYERALQQRERQVLRAAEITAQECTFKPQLATKGARAASKKQQPPPSLKDEEKGQEQQQQEASGSPSTGGGDSPGLEGTTKRFQKLYLDAQVSLTSLESTETY